MASKKYLRHIKALEKKVNKRIEPFEKNQLDTHAIDQLRIMESQINPKNKSLSRLSNANLKLLENQYLQFLRTSKGYRETLAQAKKEMQSKNFQNLTIKERIKYLNEQKRVNEIIGQKVTYESLSGQNINRIIRAEYNKGNSVYDTKRKLADLIENSDENVTLDLAMEKFDLSFDEIEGVYD